MPKIENKIPITKVDEDKRLVFGFFNINKIGKELVEDHQGDLIETDELEKAIYNFVLEARVAGESHIEKKEVGQLVECFMITKEKQEAIVATLKSQGIDDATMDLGIEGAWGGFYISDDAVWEDIKKGDFPMFSIGGSGAREEIEE